jgi:hypothetical protein
MRTPPAREHGTDFESALGLIELDVHRIQCGERPIGAGLHQHLLNHVWLLAGLVDPAAVTEVHQHAFGTERNQRAGAADEQQAWATAGEGSTGRSLEPVAREWRSCSKKIKRLGSRALPEKVRD